MAAVAVAIASMAAAAPPSPASAGSSVEGWTVTPVEGPCETRDGSEPLRDSPRPPDLPSGARAFDFLVRPVLLIASDVADDPAASDDLAAYRDRVCPVLADVQQWFGARVAGPDGAPLDFAFQRPVEVRSDRDLRWFGCEGIIECREPVRWENFLADLAAKGLAWYEPDRVTIAFMPGAGAFSGGAYVGGPVGVFARSPDGPARLARGAAGVALLGDLALAGLAERCDRTEWWCSLDGGEPRDQQTGAVAHELGHAFGLRHPEAACDATPAVGVPTCGNGSARFAASVMGAWWDFPARNGLAPRGLNPEEVAQLAENAMFAPVDGDVPVASAALPGLPPRVPAAAAATIGDP